MILVDKKLLDELESLLFRITDEQIPIFSSNRLKSIHKECGELILKIKELKKNNNDIFNYNKFKNGWATGSMQCKKCNKIVQNIRFRYCLHDKVEGEWPKCCGLLMNFCSDWVEID